ncbi:MAG: molybdopterin-synthase adenylyltransferase MoeB [marine benthic group bacterium]|nr:molybdopterin-synthase adenylyltransferase MoeB [Candidatus Benthicola marisminoris]
MGLTPEETLRYHRQIILPQVGPEGQTRLKESSVLLVGAGGLGSPVALYLAAAGVGRLGIADGDVVELSNLQRQVLHDTPSVGRSKTESAHQRIGRVNPDVAVVEYPVRLDSSNALEIMEGWDVVVDGSDNFPTRYLVNDACVLLGIPFVYGAIFRFEGQVSVFGRGDGPCYRCLFRDPPPPEAVPTCAEAGVLGVLPGLVGTIQATEALKLLLDKGDSLAGRLLLVDTLPMEFREVEVRRDPDCAVCGDDPSVTALIDYEQFCGGTTTPLAAAPELQRVPEIDVEELRSRLGSGQSPVILDVRETHEWRISNLGPYGAKLVPLGRLQEIVGELDPDRELVVYCRSGYRSAIAVQQLASVGFDRAINLRGGINEWARRIDPSLPTY